MWSTTCVPPCEVQLVSSHRIVGGGNLWHPSSDFHFSGITLFYHLITSVSEIIGISLCRRQCKCKHERVYLVGLQCYIQAYSLKKVYSFIVKDNWEHPTRKECLPLLCLKPLGDNVPVSQGILFRIFIAVLKHHDQRASWEERVNSVYNSTRQELK